MAIATSTPSVISADRSATRLEVAGAFGDIGVLFPISIALITLNHLNPTAVFLCAGLTYVLSGRYFRVPMPVQPLKAVAAIALAMGLPPSAIASAGLEMGILLALIGLTNAAAWLAKLFSVTVVRGLQLGLGLLLIRQGLRLILSPESTLMLLNGELFLPGWALGLFSAVVLCCLIRSPRYPAALVLLTLGILLGWFAHWGNLPSVALGPLPIEFLKPRTDEFRQVLILLVIPQFALTFGNSIVATESTAQILYGPRAERVTVRALTLSIAIVNLISGLLQASPLCHGSGGMTAHYKFGARGPKSSYVIGAVCLTLALLGGSAVEALSLIPTAILGLFLIFVGIQHAGYLRYMPKGKSLLLCAVSVGVVSLLTTNLMWGFVTGIVGEVLLRLCSKARDCATEE